MRTWETSAKQQTISTQAASGNGCEILVPEDAILKDEEQTKQINETVVKVEGRIKICP